jgi:hypothetical protein
MIEFEKHGFESFMDQVERGDALASKSVFHAGHSDRPLRRTEFF